MAAGAFSRFEWLLAGRYLRPRKKEGFISVIAGFSFLGIMLGVATLIIVMSVMNGFRTELLSRILGLNGHILVQSAGPSLQNFDRVAQEVRSVPGVTFVTPMVEGQVMATHLSLSTGVIVRGLRAEDFRKLPLLSTSLKAGSLDQFEGDQGVVVGTRLADQMGLRLGDTITLISPNGPVTPFGTTPRIKSYPIIALFEIGMSEYDRAFVYMPLEEAQLYFGTNGGVTQLEVRVDNPDEVERYRGLVAAALTAPLVRVADWKQLNDSYFNALQVERNVMFLILTLIILVAALNIVSGLIMLVKEKGQAIAILRTMGASQGAIMRVFLITGASIGVSGTLAGFLIGVLFCDNIETIRQFLMNVTGTNLFDPAIYFLSQLPAKMDPQEVASVVVMALALSFLATLYPSWQAARLDPVEALRYE